MWTTLAMAAALSVAPNPVGELTVTNVRPTYGLYGAVRKDADAPKVVPGDVFFLSFDVENLKVAPDGLVKYSVGMEWTNKEKKVLYREEPKELPVHNSLGTGRVPGFAAAVTGADTPAGEY